MKWRKKAGPERKSSTFILKSERKLPGINAVYFYCRGKFPRQFILDFIFIVKAQKNCHCEGFNDGATS